MQHSVGKHTRFAEAWRRRYAQPIMDTARCVLISPPMPWRPTIDAQKLKRENGELERQLLRVREELKERYATGLEILLRERLNALAGKGMDTRRLQHYLGHASPAQSTAIQGWSAPT